MAAEQDVEVEDDLARGVYQRGSVYLFSMQMNTYFQRKSGYET
jgi:hypothetical protein